MANQLNEASIKAFLQKCNREEFSFIKTQMADGKSTEEIFQSIIDSRAKQPKAVERKPQASGSWMDRFFGQREKRHESSRSSDAGCGAYYASYPSNDMFLLQSALMDSSSGAAIDVSPVTSPDHGTSHGHSHSHSHSHDNSSSQNDGHGHSHDSSPSTHIDAGGTSHDTGHSSGHSCHSHGCSSGDSGGSSCGSSCGGGCGSS